MRIVAALGGNAPAEATGKMAAIGQLTDAQALLEHRAGTIIEPDSGSAAGSGLSGGPDGWRRP